MLKIVSHGDSMTAYWNDATFEWVKGSHTVNVYGLEPYPVDCFTFGFDKNRTSMLDFTETLQRHLDYLEA